MAALYSDAVLSTHACLEGHSNGGCPAPAAGGLQQDFQYPRNLSFLLHMHFQHLFFGKNKLVPWSSHFIKERCCSAFLASINSTDQNQGKTVITQHATVWPHFLLRSRNKGPRRQLEGKRVERGLNRANIPKKVRSSLLEYFCQETRQKKTSGS